jgi:hypothetical protein
MARGTAPAPPAPRCIASMLRYRSGRRARRSGRRWLRSRDRDGFVIACPPSTVACRRRRGRRERHIGVRLGALPEGDAVRVQQHGRQRGQGRNGHACAQRTAGQRRPQAQGARRGQGRSLPLQCRDRGLPDQCWRPRRHKSAGRERHGFGLGRGDGHHGLQDMVARRIHRCLVEPGGIGEAAVDESILTAAGAYPCAGVQLHGAMHAGGQ